MVAFIEMGETQVKELLIEALYKVNRLDNCY